VKIAVRVHHAGMGYRELVAIWQAADRLGYDGASLYDLIGRDCLECWTTLTALSEVSSRLALIPLTLANTYRHPALLAKMAATLDVISSGRLILGLGAGGLASDHHAHGLAWEPTPVRVARTIEAVRVMRLLWGGEPVSFDGRYYRLDGARGVPRPTAPSGAPVLIGGHGPRHLLRAVAVVADLCNVGADLSLAEWARVKETIAGHCNAVGRDPASIGLTHNATVVLGSTAAEVARGRERAVAAGRSLTGALIGTPGEVTDALVRYRDAGIAWTFAIFPDLPRLESLELFGHEVLPRLRT
jgi:alkanesulfonate monooxygenase SsuD/methylene tetrahydromethanopterin reductase-like flavin-dependent oxidoreductase (luciferase family)